MAPYSGPTRSPISTNARLEDARLDTDRTEPAFGRTGAPSPRRSVLFAKRPTDLAAARPSPSAPPRLDELTAAPRRLDLRAGERMSVASIGAADGGHPSIVRIAAIVAVAALACIGIAAVLHTFGLKLPF